MQLVRLEHGQASLADLLRYAHRIEREVNRYITAAVQDARGGGTSWGEVAQAAGVQAETARLRWSTARVQRQLRGQSVVSWRPGPDGGEGQLPDGSMGLPSQALSAALSHLHRRSGMTIGDVAREADLSAPYLSRVLAGERVPSWPVVHMLATILSGAPPELRFLWEAARGVTLPPRRPVCEAAARLHAALRGLHLAAGSPDPARLAEGTLLSPRVIREVLKGDHIPDWPLLSRLVIQLGARPAAVRPLWEELHYAFLASHDIFPQGGIAAGGTDS
ncbi:helix-turn-helix domain-containing protein [Streptomyces sp. R302]|uniref:helix-turn-helix domain-containing protein n=1 Tax=unclassified Streptomyces TaxID=2593676 RepID=UPI00145C406F|nr:helix-turn-helix domain-containing protein [Streptomyces sp. R301]NML80681.1 helix-turn-helix domain-containing protein [Streptomyces sp. R302]